MFEIKNEELFKKYIDSFMDYMIDIDNKLEKYPTDPIHWNTAYLLSEPDIKEGDRIYFKKYPAREYAMNDKEDMDEYMKYITIIGSISNFLKGLFDKIPNYAYTSPDAIELIDNAINELYKETTVQVDMIRLVIPRACDMLEKVWPDIKLLMHTFKWYSKFY